MACCCCSVTKLYPSLCNPMNYSTPGFPVLHYVKLISIELVMLSNHLIHCHLLLLLPSIFPSIIFCFLMRFFLMSWLFPSGGQRTWASASVLPKSIQGSLPVGLTGLNSLLSKGLSRVPKKGQEKIIWLQIPLKILVLCRYRG